MEPRTAPGLKPAKPLVSTALPRKLPGIDHYLDSDLRAQLARKYGDLSKKGNAAAPRIQQTAQFVAVASTRLPAPPLGFGGARLGAMQPARGGGGRPAARSIDDADYVTRREFETRLKMMDDKLQLLAVALRQREAQHEDLELQVRELAARLPMPGANFGGAPGRASHHQSPRHMPWQPGGGAGEPEYYDGDAALVHPDGDLDDEEGGAFDEVGGDEQPIGEAGIVSVPPGSGGMVQIDLENEYSNPVVVASLVPGSFCPSPVAGQSWQSAVEPDARTTVCVPFADGSSFTIQLYGGGGDGPGDDDERHVAYVVVEAGTHTLASGGTLIAGQALVPPGRPEPLSFEAPFARPPSVLCTLMQSTAVDDDTMIRASCGLVDPAGCSLAADLVAARPDGSPPPRPGHGAAPTLSLPPSPPPSPPEGGADGEAPPPAEAPAAEAEAEAAAPAAEAEAAEAEAAPPPAEAEAEAPAAEAEAPAAEAEAPAAEAAPAAEPEAAVALPRSVSEAAADDEVAAADDAAAAATAAGVVPPLPVGGLVRSPAGALSDPSPGRGDAPQLVSYLAADCSLGSDGVLSGVLELNDRTCELAFGTEYPEPVFLCGLMGAPQKWAADDSSLRCVNLQERTARLRCEGPLGDHSPGEGGRAAWLVLPAGKLWAASPDFAEPFSR